MDIEKLVFDSSDVQRIEVERGSIYIAFHPHRYVLPENTNVIFDGFIFRKGTAPRFLNHGNNILFFANEAHRLNFLKRMGFSEEWIGTHLLPEENLADVIPLFPTTKTKEPETELQVAAR